MIPAHFSYAAWMMKSAESSAGLAPATWAMQSGALSMIAGIAVLPEVAPALCAHGPLHRGADDGQHDRDGDEEAEHLGSRPLEIRQLAVVPLEPGDRCRLHQRPVRLEYLLPQHAHLRVDERPVLDQVQPLQLDGGGHAQD